MTAAMDADIRSALIIAAKAGDLDAALEMGLLDVDLSPQQEASDDTEWLTVLPQLVQWQTERRQALAARERYRAKQARELAKQKERAARRAGQSTATGNLPSVAQAALERAKARAAARKSQA